MADIIPFRGYLYNREKIKNIGDVVAPPYDVIPKEDYKKYYQKHANNIIHVILGKDYPHDSSQYNKFTRAAEHLNGWIDNHILGRDTSASLYVYYQKYFTRSRKVRLRKGFICLVRLEDYKNGVIFPHEETFSKTKEALFHLKKACRANLSPIFSLYSEPENLINQTIEQEIANKEPLIAVTDADSTQHMLWKYSNAEGIDRIRGLMEDKKCIIADGHHRYETSLALRNILRRERGNPAGMQSYDYVMMYLTNMDDEGLSIRPTHRVVRKPEGTDENVFMEGLKKNFNITPFEYGKRKEFFHELKQRGKKEVCFGLFAGKKGFSLLTLRDKDVMEKYRDDSKPKEWWNLDVTILQKLVIEEALGLKDGNEDDIVYTHDDEDAIRRAEENKGVISLFMNPTRIKNMQKVVSLGAKMPQKSTYFFPKLLTGLVINKFE